MLAILIAHTLNVGVSFLINLYIQTFNLPVASKFYSECCYRYPILQVIRIAFLDQLSSNRINSEKQIQYPQSLHLIGKVWCNRQEKKKKSLSTPNVGEE